MTDYTRHQLVPREWLLAGGEWGRADTGRRHQCNLLGTASVHRSANFALSVSLLFRRSVQHHYRS